MRLLPRNVRERDVPRVHKARVVQWGSMFSLQKFFGKDPKFFDLLEASAEEACKSARALKALVQEGAATTSLHTLKQARIESKGLTERIGELAVKTFITVLEREDIESLANALYKIPKPIEKFAERYEISREVLGSGLPYQQVDMIEDATVTVYQMVRCLRKGMNLELMRRLNTKIQNSEAEADRLENDLLRDLYKSNQNILQIVLIRDLYDLLERVIDRCRDAGNIIMHICHKNS